MNKTDINEIEVNGVAYIRKDSVAASAPAVNTDGLECVMVRSRDSGVHVGYLEKRDGSEVRLLNSRRIWFWDGAATLSQLSQEGTKSPDNCKFPASVPTIVVLGVCEILPVTEKARASIFSVKEWNEG